MTPQKKAKLIVILNTITIILGLITVIILLRVIRSASAQYAYTNEKIIASQKLTENDMRCLAAFFSQPNRQNIRISNLENCEILHTDSGKTENLPLSPVTAPTQSSPAVPSSDTKQNSTSTTTSTQLNNTPNQDTTSQTPAKSQTVPQVQDAINIVQQAVPTPVAKLLGMTLCTTPTNTCWR